MSLSWVLLIGSGVMECVWAAALDKSEGFTHPIPVIIFVVAMVLSMLGLSHAVRDIPLGIAYSVWVGIGATLTLLYSVFFGGESMTPLQIMFAVGLIVCVVGLKMSAAS
ncbi:MAG: multidrug efflux SMR transporter [Coriobacteriales bacterium]|jgi:quaternary ammonium compound-resistance protein SugE